MLFAPPLPTQRKIAAVLSAYDDLIENNPRRIKILEDMAQTLYRLRNFRNRKITQKDRNKCLWIPGPMKNYRRGFKPRLRFNKFPSYHPISPISINRSSNDKSGRGRSPNSGRKYPAPAGDI